MKVKILKNNDGVILPIVLIFGLLAMIILGGIVSWAMINLRVSQQAVKREAAFEIAESGSEYYRWHLAHAPTDYKDGTASPGPYVHQFYDKDGNLIGSFSLAITAPLIGSTVVTVKSTGRTVSGYNGSRTIETQLAKPSMAKYSVVANDNMRFGAGTVVYGPITSNKGIHFDGVAHNLIASALSTYTDPDYNNPPVFGVYTMVAPTDPYPPAAVPSRSDVFMAGREFPVPAIDFTGLTADLSQMKTDAQANGFWRAGSGSLGYDVILKTNNTFDLYKVTALKAAPNGCSNSNNQTGWGTWSVNSQTLLGNYPIPANGLLFLEDNIFVEGQIRGSRVTIAAATFPVDPSTWKSITVNNNLLYTNYDGTDVISLIAQDNINVGLYSQNTLEIDAALVSENGRAGRYYYSANNCGSNATRSSLTLNGMIASDLRYGFAYTDNTGYQTRNIIYDANLLYSPPPSFPQTSDQYTTITWQEIQ
jgi:Tfp pilus assembly protein PilX